MISTTVFFTILLPLMLVLAIVLDVAGRDLTVAPLVVRDRQRMY
jgi:hypothetical protein